MSQEPQNTSMVKRKAPRSAWKKGQSGNPGGRPKVEKDLRAAAQKRAMECLDGLWQLATTAESEQVRRQAFNDILDRAFGKPQQAVEVNASVVNFAALVQQAQDVAADEANEEAGLAGAV